jgi:hypothetical protein
VRGPAAQHLANAQEDAFRISQNVVVPEPQHEKSSALEEACSDLIVLHHARMLPAIDLDYEPMRETDEIDDVSSDRFLSPKLETGELIAET